MSNYVSDKCRYTEGKMPAFQKYYRLTQESNNFILQQLFRLLFRYFKKKNLIDLHYSTNIGPGLYIGHPYCITINSKVIIGTNCNIHKGVTIGQENRGARKGTPILGDDVWIGINSTIVGAVRIGNDVLIAPNTYVNRDIPDHSIVFGNPCIIKSTENATKGYINNRYEDEL